MENTLTSFLKGLATGENPDLLLKYVKDPVGAMNDAGISKEHQDIIMNGDSKSLSSVLKNEGAYDDGKTFLMVLLRQIHVV